MAFNADARLWLEARGGVQAIPALVQAVTQLTAQPSARPTLVDNKGIGKPTAFDGAESKYREWAAKFESFVVGVRMGPGSHGHHAGRALAWCLWAQRPRGRRRGGPDRGLRRDGDSAARGTAAVEHRRAVRHHPGRREGERVRAGAAWRAASTLPQEG
eukprot:9466207-Pyramimonas_sp.AAC.2